MSLQPPDDNGLVFRPKHASAFAQFLHRAYARARGAEQIGLQDGARGPSQIAGGNLLDELGNIDVRRTGVRTRSIEAHQASCCFNGGFVARKWRQKFVEGIRTRRSLLDIRQPILLIVNPYVRCNTQDKDKVRSESGFFQ
jgi:hypothetical protein